MPKKIIDYSKTIIYKLVCNDLNIKDIYIGHTTNWIKRKQSHKERCTCPNSKKYHLKVYQIMRDHGGWENWSMIEIEKYPCNDQQEATKRERYWFETLSANMNILNPNKNKKEYWDENKDKINSHRRQYYIENTETMKEKTKYRSVVYVCPCGMNYTLRHKARHEKSKKHQDYITQQEQEL